jgi:hypothetical protein
MPNTRLTAALLAAALAFPVAVHADVTQEQLDAISTPDEVATSIGTLRFIDGAPRSRPSTWCNFVDGLRA